MRPVLSVVDLFAGVGGFSEGFLRVNRTEKKFQFALKLLVDSDPTASFTFKKNYPRIPFWNADIAKLKAEELLKLLRMRRGELDILIGGPPCQGFSTLGKQDQEDERNSLWRYYADTIVRAKPKYFVVENVAAFARSSQFQDFLEATSRGGLLENYGFECDILNAADFGAFQARKRTVIIGYHRDLGFPGFPDPTHVGRHRTVGDAFREIDVDPDGIDLPNGDEVAFAGKTFAGPFTSRELHLGRNYRPLSLARFAKIPAGGNRFNIPDELLADCWKKHTSGSGDVMGRLREDKPSVTIRTEFFKPEKGRYLHPSADRAITHFEAAVLQGFPHDHKFVGSKTAIARQIGNAVPIPLGRAIGKALARRF